MKSKGREGEDLAVKHLIKNDYKLKERNYRYKRGEVDIIAEKNEILCFIEVKLRNSNAFGDPETFVSEKQQELIIATAEHYIMERDWYKDIRFDIIAIKKKYQELELRHFEDAFY